MLKVLIFDDDPDIAELLKEWLSDFGITADVAFTLAATKDRIKAQPYDLIFSDLIAFEGYAGVEIFNFLQTQAYKGKFVIASGAFDAEEVLNEKGVVLDAFLKKPFNSDSLSEVLNKVGLGGQDVNAGR
jgi:DNA-binding NtrC family response regulator